MSGGGRLRASPCTRSCGGRKARLGEGFPERILLIPRAPWSAPARDMRVSRVSFGCRFVVWRRSVEGDPRDPLTTVLGGSQNNIFDTLGALERSRSCHARFQCIVWGSFCCLAGIVWGRTPHHGSDKKQWLGGGSENDIFDTLGALGRPRSHYALFPGIAWGTLSGGGVTK